MLPLRILATYGIDWVVGFGELHRKIVAITSAVGDPTRGRMGLSALAQTLGAVGAVWNEPTARGPSFDGKGWRHHRGAGERDLAARVSTGDTNPPRRNHPVGGGGVVVGPDAVPRGGAAGESVQAEPA
jgi:hypothetical protein